MKIDFSHIEISNFLSYGNNVTRVDLHSENPVLIVGRNFVASEDGSDSNGAGKSTILNAICYCLYGEVIMDNVNVDKLINNINKKDLLVSIYLTVDGTRYKIQRFRKNKAMGGDGVKIFKNGNDNWEFAENDEFAPDSIANFNKLIVKIIGKSFGIFSRIIAISATSKPFLSLESPKQIEFLEELFGYSEVTEKAEQIKESLKDTKRTFEKEEAINNALIAELNRRDIQISQLTEMASSWNEKHTIAIANVKKQISDIKDIDFALHEKTFASIELLTEKNKTLSQEIADANRKIELAKSESKKFEIWEANKVIRLNDIGTQLGELRVVDFASLIKDQEEKDELLNQINIIEREIKSQQVKINDLTRLMSKMDEELNTLADSTCPYCSQHMPDAGNHHAKILENKKETALKIKELYAINSGDEEIKANMEARVKEISLLGKHSKSTLLNMQYKLETLTKEKETLEKEANPHNSESIFLEPEVIEENQSLILKNNDKLSKLNTKIKIKDKYELSQLKASSTHLQNRLEELEQEANPHDAAIESLNNQEVPELKDSVLNELTKLMKHQDFLIKLLTKKDSFVRKSLLQKSIPLLNARLKLYLSKMGLPHKVTFLENMKTEIKQFDTEMDFNQLSAGQRARINLALSFSFRDVLQYKHGLVNLCVLDECLDVGLSNIGVQLAVKFIKEVAKEQKIGLFVISHKDEANSMFDNKMFIEYKNGFSNIVNEKGA